MKPEDLALIAKFADSMRAYTQAVDEITEALAEVIRRLNADRAAATSPVRVEGNRP